MFNFERFLNMSVQPCMNHKPWPVAWEYRGFRIERRKSETVGLPSRYDMWCGDDMYIGPQDTLLKAMAVADGKIDLQKLA